MISRYALATLVLATPCAAQVSPHFDPLNPRMQTSVWQVDQAVLLTVLPGIGTTVMLDPQDRITQVRPSDRRSWEVSVSPEGNGFHIVPRREDAGGTLEIATRQGRAYRFALATGDGLASAMFLRFVGAGSQATPPGTIAPPSVPRPQAARVWSYKLRGDRSVRPLTVSDDGARTVVAFAAEQPLPAIFAIGPTGEEEVVDGHMRGGRFIIDRVHEELVFRIDKDRAVAKRRGEPDDGR